MKEIKLSNLDILKLDEIVLHSIGKPINIRIISFLDDGSPYDFIYKETQDKWRYCMRMHDTLFLSVFISEPKVPVISLYDISNIMFNRLHNGILYDVKDENRLNKLKSIIKEVLI